MQFIADVTAGHENAFVNSRTDCEARGDEGVNELRRTQTRSARSSQGPDTMYPVNSRVWLTMWIGLIVVVVVPWGTFDPHAHWERMEWIPFVSPPVDLGDVIGNLFFYVPYGILVGREAAETRGAILLATGSATVLSLATEFTQIFSQSRFPSMTDVACNVVGAYIGASWAIHRHGEH